MFSRNALPVVLCRPVVYVYLFFAISYVFSHKMWIHQNSALIGRSCLRRDDFTSTTGSGPLVPPPSFSKSLRKMTEKGEEDDPPPSSSGLDWEKLFKMAEDPDLDDILQSPLEEALKQLLDEKEVPKLKAIRSLPTLLESHGDECIEKLLPAIQQCLKDEKSNLDIHCEAAVVYKSIFQNDLICQKFPGLVQLLLEHILSNICQQKDNLSAAAWLETLVEVAERVSLDAVKQFIVPVVQQQAEPVQRVQRRVIAAKLLHKLADILPSDVVRKELGPCAQQLCQDANSNVRTAMAQRLPTIARALKNQNDCVCLLLPCFVQLCKDDDSGVRESCLNNLNECLSHFTAEAKKKTIIPLIRKTAELCLEKKDDTLPVIARHLGTWAFNLWSDLDKLDRSWILNTYLKMVAETKVEVTGAAAQTNMKLTKKMTAFNLPCMVELFPNSFERISPIFQSFCEDHDDDVRLAVAASFHELLERQPKTHQLLESFVDLIRGGAPEVVSKLTGNLDKTLPILYKLAAESNGKVTRVQLDRMLLGCNQLLRGTGAWRAHESLLRNLTVLRQVLSISHIQETFIPLLQKEVLQARAIPCRIAAVNSLLIFTREQPDATKRLAVISFLKDEVAGHKACYRRLLYLEAAETVLKLFSRGFFMEHFLVEVIKLTHDEVANVRLKAIRLLSRIKSFLILPDDDGKLQELENAVGAALSEEKEPLTRQLLQTYACELSRGESRIRGDKEDAKKVEEEKVLWSEERQRQQKKEEKSPSPRISTKERTPLTPPGRSGLRPPEGPVRAVSPWRSQRKAVAVVRPQPVVVMRASSPAPAARPSRLPMSIAARDKEDRLKKFDSSLPRPVRGSSMGRSPSSSAMSSSTSSLDSPTAYGLRRSATTSSGFGSISTSTSSYPLMSSRSFSQIRRPTYGLTKVSSRSTLEKRPSQLKVRLDS